MTNKEATSALKTPRFIIDSPAERDELSPHQRIADSVVEVLRHDDRIKLIGLLGGWGSGKSTVIKLIEGALQAGEASDLRCFTFDAWEHQSDPPRRAFLEAFAFFLRTDDGFPDLKDRKKAWRKELDRLNRQREKSRTKTTPTLTVPGAWYLISLVGLTIGLRLVGDGSLSEEDQRDLWARTIFVVGWILVSGPLLVAGITWLRWRPQLRASLSWFTENKKGRRKHSLLAVFANKQVDTRQELKLRNPEPSAMEFQTVFRNFVSEAVASGPRLVVIIDNLDRLPADEAMTIWSTVRSLFLGSDHEQKICRDQLPTVIMPIDETALSRIYKDKAGKMDGALAQSFIDKTFHLVFHVPQPVLSRWHAYLRARLSEVFGADVDDDWPHTIASAYEGWLATRPALGGVEGKTRMAVPTPREINALVNAVAVTWLQRRGETFDMAMIAYFAVWRREIDDLHQHLEHDPAGRDFSEHQQLQLAALVYGVDLDDAAELFLEEPLKLAMEGRDQKSFDNLIKFDRHVLRYLSGAASGHQILSAFFAAELLRAAPSMPHAWAADAWSSLRDLAVARLGAELFRSEEAVGLEALFESCPAPLSQKFVRDLGAALGELAIADVHGDKAKAFAFAAGLLAEHARRLDVADFVIEFPGGASRYINLLSQDVDVDTLRAIVPKSETMNEVVERLANQAVVSSKRKHIAEPVRRLIKRGPDTLNWTPVLLSATALIENGRGEGMADAIGVMFALYLGPPAAQQDVNQAILSGYVRTAHSWLWVNALELEALAESTTLLLRANHEARSGDHRSWEDRLQEQPELLQLIDKRVKESGLRPSLSWAMSRLGSWPSEAPLLRALTQIWIDEMDIDAEAVFADPQVAINLIPESARPAFWRRMMSHDAFWDFLRMTPIEQAAPIYRALRASDGSQAVIMRNLSRRLHDTSENDWLNVLESGAEPFGMATELPDPRRRAANAGPAAHAALNRSISAMLARDDPAFTRRWFDLAAKLSPPARTVLNQQLAAEMTATPMSGRRIKDVFDSTGVSLLREGDFTAQADRAVVQLVFPLVADDEGLAWLVAHISWVRSWVDMSRSATREALREQIMSRVVQNAPAARLLALSLGYAKADGSAA